VDPVPDPLLLRKSGNVDNRTRDLCGLPYIFTYFYFTETYASSDYLATFSRLHKRHTYELNYVRSEVSTAVTMESAKRKTLFFSEDKGK
jgi:hypothetical protein